MASAPACCCCASNNVRHLILVLVLFTTTALYSNIVVFHLVGLYEPGIPDDLRIASLITVDGKKGRFRRAVLNSSIAESADAVTEALPLSVNDTATQQLIAASEEIQPKPTRRTPRPRKQRVKPTITAQGEVSAVKPVPTSQVAAPPLPPAVPSPSISSTEEPHPVVNSEKKEEEKAAPPAPPPPTEPPVPKFFTNPTVETTTTPKRGKFYTSDKDYFTSPTQEKLPASENEENAVEGDSSEPAVTRIATDFLGFTHRALLWSAPFLAALVVFAPILVLIRSTGARKVFPVLLTISGIATILLPFSFDYGVYAIIGVRAVQGLALAGAWPLAGAVAANWGTIKEQVTFVATILLFIPLAPLISWSTSAFALGWLGWSTLWIYIAHGAVSIFFALFFAIFYRDRPQYHPWVNGLELNRIVTGKEMKNRMQSGAARGACSSLARSLSAWSIWLGVLGETAALAVVITFLPVVLVAVIDAKDHEASTLGLYAAFGFSAVPVVTLFVALLSRATSCCSASMQVRIWNSLAFVLTAVVFVGFSIGIRLVEEHKYDRSLLWAFLPAVVAPLGATAAGWKRSLTLVGRYFGQHILAHATIPFLLAHALIPIFAVAIVQNNETTEWLRVFVAVAGILIVTAVAFAFFGRGRSAGWAAGGGWDPSVTSRMINTDYIDYSKDECGLYELRPLGPRS